jgi:hypothetical protein
VSRLVICARERCGKYAYCRRADTPPAAKQAAFEEQTRLKNQFRPLDDAEVEFLDEIRESKRAEERRLRQETEDGLRHFREARKEREKDDRNAEGNVQAVEAESEEWSVGRKRKREKERERGVKGLKRRVSDAVEDVEPKKTVHEGQKAKVPTKDAKVVEKWLDKTPVKATSPNPGQTTVKPKMSLVEYGSDDDD